MRSFFVHEDIREAHTIDTSFYTDVNVFEASKEKIFSKAWHFIGDISMVSAPSSAYPVHLWPGVLDEPLIVVRDRQEAIRCMSNVCTHRGNLLITEPCHASQIRCGYHGRTFNPAGELLFMPEFQEVKNFPCKDDHLKQMPFHSIGPLLFTNLQSEPNAQMYFGNMLERIAHLDLTQLVRHDEYSKDYFIEANWALYVENYLEGFHIPFVHEGLAKVLNFSDYETEIFYPYSNLQLGIGKTDEYTFQAPEGHPDHGLPVSAYYFWVFPNMMFNFYPWGLSLNIVLPLAYNKTKVSFITYISDMSKYDKGAGSNLDKVEMEDEEIVLQVQKGVKSRFYNRGRYSPTREKGPHHFHRLLADHING
jgi:choline monooxygenase